MKKLLFIVIGLLSLLGSVYSQQEPLFIGNGVLLPEGQTNLVKTYTKSTNTKTQPQTEVTSYSSYDSGEFADLYVHKFSPKHLDNIKKLLELSGIDTCGYTLIPFFNGDRKFLLNLSLNAKQTDVIMTVFDNKELSIEFFNSEAKTTKFNDKKVFVVFYNTFDKAKKSQYHLYRYN